MYELKCGNRELGKRIVGINSDMMFAGVVAGNNAGCIWVDDLDNPISALVWSEGLGCFQFMGCHTSKAFINEFRSFFDSTILSFLKEKNLQCFEYAADTEEWYPIIKNMFSEYKINEDWQYVYRSNGNTLSDERIVPVEPYRLHKIDHSFFAGLNNCLKISNQEFLIDYINQFWGSIDNYIRLGTGYLIINDDKIVSFAVASGLYGKTVAVGVETLSDYRRKGLAGIVVKTLLKELHEMNYNAWWDCMASNIASQKTVESAGLQIDHKYRICWFDI